MPPSSHSLVILFNFIPLRVGNQPHVANFDFVAEKQSEFGSPLFVENVPIANLANHDKCEGAETKLFV
jgi:hypothetical protein